MYFESITKNNIIYSIDMLRLTTNITFFQFSELEFCLKTVYSDYIKKFYQSSRFIDYQYNFVIEIEEGMSFWIGFLHNSEKRTSSDLVNYSFTIEFNPNKLKMDKLLCKILYSFGDWKVRSYDLACDLSVNILDLIGFEKGNKREMKMISSGFDNKTIYIGKGDNRVKIYNKKLESNLSVNNLTRVEISKKLEDFPVKKIWTYHFDNVFPNLYLNNYLYSFKDYEDKTLLAVLYAVQNDFPFNDLTRCYKNKIKRLFESGGQKILFDCKVVDELIRKVIYHYFVQPSSKQVFL